MQTLDPDHLQLTDFMDLPTLQEIQDGFAAVANVKARITDADGNLLTQATPTREFLRRQRAIAAAEEAPEPDPGEGPQKEGREYVAPIVVNNQRLGTIRMTPMAGGVNEIEEAKLSALAAKTGIDFRQLRTAASQLLRGRRNLPAAIQFLFLLANAIARLCFQEYQLRRRIDELTAVYNVAMMLADVRDLNRVLQRTAGVVCDVMNMRASSIRLLDQETGLLVLKATHNLSAEYRNKGPIVLEKAELDQEALSTRGYSFVRDVASDPRIQYPDEARREGIVSMLSVGMRYKGTPIGVLRVYDGAEKHFTPLEIDLLKAIAAQAAAAIENARLAGEQAAAEALEKQVALAVEVQQRMVPRRPPSIPGLDLACVYVPCYELGGDLYDFIELQNNNVGLVVADVSGKGLPASLIMAAVRASLRAHVDNIFYLYEVVRRLNNMLCRDTRLGEFVTLFYGVLDSVNRRLTYCNAGHPYPLLLRNGKVSELESDDMVLGVDPAQEYHQVIMDLKAGDTLLMYTDGLTDAVNFQMERWGKQRLVEAFSQGGDTADIIAQNILWTMRRFAGLTQRTDDVTMIVVKVL